MEGFKLIYPKIPLVSPLGLTEYLINWGRVHSPYHYWVGPRASLEYLWAVLRAIVVIYI
jgi:hypothetical protein